MNYRQRLSSLAVACMLATTVSANQPSINQAAPDGIDPTLNLNDLARLTADTGVVRIATFTDMHLDFGQSAQKSGVEEYRIETPDAAFIKVHFDQFSLPEGAYVEVTDPTGTESWQYSSGKKSPMTFDPRLGQDGASSFAAMSIEGPVAIVRLHYNGANWDPSRHGLSVRRYLEGFSPELIDEIMANEPALLNLSGEPSYKSTCGVNERRDAVCYQSSHPTEFERSRPVARLVMSGGGLCTAWRVGSGNHMFTNNHCVDSQADVAAAEAWFNYQRTSCGSGGTAATTKVSGNTMLKTDYTLDYTLFTVNNFGSLSSFGYYGLDVRSPSSQEQIYIPQHGAGNPKELAITSDQNTGGVCRIDVVSATGRGTGTDTGYYCDTIGGSSGSPVLASSSNKVIALHHFGGCTNQGVRIDRIWPQVASYFNNTVPDGDNGSTPPPPPPPPPGGGSLDNGDTVSGLSDSTGDWQYWTISVPSGASNLAVNMSGGSGDADLYLRAGAQPTTSSYDCRPYLNGNSESCTVASPSATTYHIGIRAYSSYSGVSLSVSYDEPGGGGTGGGGTVNNISASQGQWKRYTLTVPAGMSSLDVDISGGSGDADLYVNFGSQSTTSNYDCRPYRNGNTESCSFSNPQAGTWYIDIRAYSTFSGVRLDAFYNP